jgi:hypothetical protein
MVGHPKAEKMWSDMLLNKNKLDLNTSWDAILRFHSLD